jgi:hypothetical protein
MVPSINRAILAIVTAVSLAATALAQVMPAQQYTQRHYSEGELEERCEDL